MTDFRESAGRNGVLQGAKLRYIFLFTVIEMPERGNQRVQRSQPANRTKGSAYSHVGLTPTNHHGKMGHNAIPIIPNKAKAKAESDSKSHDQWLSEQYEIASRRLAEYDAGLVGSTSVDEVARKIGIKDTSHDNGVG